MHTPSYFDLRLPFADRRSAGQLLAAKVVELNPERPLVLALPRGGVPVGLEIARALQAPLDLMLVRKIHAPLQHELAVAAVSEGRSPQIAMNQQACEQTGVNGRWLIDSVGQELHEIERSKHLYLADAERQPIRDRTVVLVDDGLATGTTMRAALKAVQQGHPRRIIVAVPVAPREQLAQLKQDINEVVCLASPASFDAIGAFYQDFHPLTDEEVLEGLKQARLEFSALAGKQG
ncbi:MAG TPA: phosphoribosyltransferase family protein [Aquabacterium sp.]|nr:phosphoribosyltransferase family protein [Aquabacterium sp.]